MKSLSTAVLSLIFSTSAFATPGVWMEESTHNTAIIQTKNLFDKSKDIEFRLVGPVSYSVCDRGATLTEKMISIDGHNSEFTYYVKFESKPFGDSGKCQPGEPVETISLESQGKTRWLKAKAGTTLLLVLPAGYSVERK